MENFGASQVDVGVRIEVAAHGTVGQGRQRVDVLGVIADVHIAFPPLDHARPSKQHQADHQQHGAQHPADVVQHDRHTKPPG
jgi:hypothetical protein